MIGSGVLERLAVQITADLDGLNASVAPLGQAVDRMSTEVTRKTSKIGQAFSSLGPMISGFVGGIVAGLGVEAVQAVGNFAQSTLNAADDIGDLAQRLGESTEGVQRLQVAFQQAGAAPGLMQEAMDKLNVGVGAFIQTGGGPAKAALESLGLAGKVASGELRGAENIFYAAATALEGVTDPAERARISMQLFGRSAGTDMIEVLGAGGDALRQFGIDAQASGRIMSDDMVQGLADARQEIEITKQQFSQLATVGMGRAILAAKDLSDQLGGALTEALTAISPHFDGMRAAIAPLIAAVVDFGKQAAEVFGPIVSRVLEALRILFDGVFKAIGAVVTGFIEGATAAFQSLGALLRGDFAGAWEAYKRGVMAVFGGLLDGANALMEGLLQALAHGWQPILQWLSQMVARFVQYGRDLVAGLVRGFSDAGRIAMQAVRELGENVMAAFRAALGIRSPSRVFMEYGEYISQGLAIGIRNRSPEAVAALQSLADELKGIWSELLTEEERAWLAYSEQRDAISRGQRANLLTPERAAEMRRRSDAAYEAEALRRFQRDNPTPEVEVKTGDGIRISNPTINTESLDELSRAADRAGWTQGRQIVLGVQRGISETAPAALDQFQGFANDLASVLGALSGKTEASVAEIINSLARLAATAFPEMFGTGTRGGGILSAIGSIVGAFTGNGNIMGAASGGGGFNGGFGGGRMAPANTNVRVFIGNEAIDNRMVNIATGVSAQAFSAARSQIPVDMSRAQRGTMWG